MKNKVNKVWLVIEKLSPTFEKIVGTCVTRKQSRSWVRKNTEKTKTSYPKFRIVKFVRK